MPYQWIGVGWEKENLVDNELNKPLPLGMA